MAGGKFDKKTGKVRPGTYINFESSVNEVVGSSERGIVVIPLIGHTYGPEGEFITISNSSPDEQMDKLGFSVFDNNYYMVMIKEALKLANKVIVYIPKTGTKATATGGGLSATARYGGTRGNSLGYSVLENVTGGFDVSVYLADSIVEQFVGITSADELSESKYIAFTESSTIEAAAGITLSGATAAEASNSDITTFLDRLESISFNTLAFTSEDASLKTACKTKTSYMRNDMGRCVNAVIPNFAADYEGIINVTNSVVVDGTALTIPQVTAWVAAAYASASETQSNTYLAYDGATAVIGQKTHEESVKAINDGEFFFSNSENGTVVVEYDINSLVTFGNGKDSSYRKNRVIRVLDAVATAIQSNFPPNKFDNGEDGWNVMEGIGVALLQQFEEDGAITNVDTESDFVVDKALSKGDSTYFNVAITPVDSAEKLYFSVTTR